MFLINVFWLCILIFHQNSDEDELCHTINNPTLIKNSSFDFRGKSPDYISSYKEPIDYYYKLMETYYKTEHVHLPILECFILDDEEIYKVSRLIFKSFLFSISYDLFYFIITSCIMNKLDILLWSYFLIFSFIMVYLKLNGAFWANL